jgi:hypothetical protein
MRRVSESKHNESKRKASQKTTLNVESLEKEGNKFT